MERAWERCLLEESLRGKGDAQKANSDDIHVIDWRLFALERKCVCIEFGRHSNAGLAGV
ncbi:hypothetical protein D3C72_2156570 [compost metagenome]